MLIKGKAGQRSRLDQKRFDLNLHFGCYKGIHLLEILILNLDLALKQVDLQGTPSRARVGKCLSMCGQGGSGGSEYLGVNINTDDFAEKNVSRGIDPVPERKQLFRILFVLLGRC